MTARPLENRRILLVIGGGIAAYKSLDLIRRLRERGAAVRPLLTRGAQEFITPLAAAALAGEQVADLGEQRDVLRDLLLGGVDAEAAVAALDHLVHRQDDGEVDGGGDEQEVDDGGEHHAELHEHAVDVEHEPVVEARRAEQRGDQRHEDRLDHRVHDLGERSADDHGHGQVDDVALHDEVLESLKHGHECRPRPGPCP